ncbi:hypothetical protein ACJA3J_05695 [Halobacillus sp. SY10]|uniref:hypothetical protein n=1 Tax=Halobacillus sp. SY10 TaxID=3381356 RepID=UPI00387A5BC4
MPVRKIERNKKEWSRFNFKAHINSMAKHLKGYQYINEWKKYWNEKLTGEDLSIKKKINENAYFDHLADIDKEDIRDPERGVEVFQSSYVSEFGEFHYHFNVEAINKLVNEREVPLEKVEIDHLYIDPDTEYHESKISDKRHPIFLRWFLVKEPIICVDGNKRILSNLRKGKKEFNGFLLSPLNISKDLFLFDVDYWFYVYTSEIEIISRGLNAGLPHNQIHQYTLNNR